MRTFLRFLLLLPILTGCSTGQMSASSSRFYDYSEVEDKQISYLDAFKCKEAKYFIYYYQVDCYHCHGIKSKVIYYSLTIGEPFFFIEVDKDYGFLSRCKEDTIGTNNPYKAFALMTPQLSIVVNGYIAETYIGEDEVINLIDK